jgi:hypothetical protein
MGLVLTMNECLTIDDEDEEDHRWFNSGRSPYTGSERRTPVKRNDFFSLKFYSGTRFLMHSVKNPLISAISQKTGFSGAG